MMSSQKVCLKGLKYWTKGVVYSKRIVFKGFLGVTFFIYTMKVKYYSWCNTLVTAHMDMVKTRLMLQRGSSRRNYKNGFHCAYQVLNSLNAVLTFGSMFHIPMILSDCLNQDHLENPAWIWLCETTICMLILIQR